jgi:hypothetical protein
MAIDFQPYPQPPTGGPPAVDEPHFADLDQTLTELVNLDTAFRLGRMGLDEYQDARESIMQASFRRSRRRELFERLCGYGVSFLVLMLGMAVIAKAIR